MVSQEVKGERLSEAEKDTFVRRLDDAARLLGAEKVPKMVLLNGNGTWDVGCTLEGESGRLETVLSYLYLYPEQDLPDTL